MHRDDHARAAALANPETAPAASIVPDELPRHRRQNLPASCFTYTPDTHRPASRRRSYRLVNGRAEPKRLPKAIQFLFTTYRDAHAEGRSPQGERTGATLPAVRAAA
jgi:hypothetical protein